MVENELLDPVTMPDPFGSVLRSYYATLERYRLLTYGQQIARAVSELGRPELAAEVHGTLRHLIVDVSVIDRLTSGNPAVDAQVDAVNPLLR